MFYQILSQVPGEAWHVGYEYDRKSDAQHDLRGLKALHPHIRYKIVKAPKWQKRDAGSSRPNPAGVKAQIRRLPTGQIQIKIPLKLGRRPNPGPQGKRFSVQVSKYYGGYKGVGGQIGMHTMTEHDTLEQAKASARKLAKRYRTSEVLIYDSSTKDVDVVRPFPQSNPVRIEQANGDKLALGIARLERYGDSLLKLGNNPKMVAEAVRHALGNRVESAVIIADDGRGGRAYNPRSCNPSRGSADSVSSRELELFIDNDATLYRQQYQPILKNLATKKARGIYDHAKAVKLFMYLMESGAKKYAKEYGGAGANWHEMFNVPTRMAAAKSFANSFETEYGYGNYDNFLPKKYQKKANPGQVGWNVYLGGKWIDKVFYNDSYTSAEEVKRSLVDHDGYDPGITVRRESKRK